MDLNAVLESAMSFFPPWLQALAKLFMAVVAAFSAFAMTVKPMLGDPRPGKDPRWKQAAFFAMHFVDFFAGNTETIRSKDKIAKLKAGQS